MRHRVAAVQLAPRIGDVQGNVDDALARVDAAVDQGADLVVLPELFNTGYFCHTGHCDTAYFDLAESREGATVSALREFASARRVIVCGGFFERGEAGAYYNSACLIGPDGEVLGVYRKTHLPWSLTGWEKFYMRPGARLPVFDTPFGRVGVMLCYDRDFPEVARALAAQGAEMILLPNGSSSGMVSMWKQIVRVRAYENQVFVVGSCLTGELDREHGSLGGCSMVVGPSGDVLGVLDEAEGNLIVQVDLDELEQARRRRFMWRDRRPELYANITCGQGHRGLVAAQRS